MKKQLHLYLVSLGALAVMLTVVFVASSGDAGAAPSLVANGNFDTNNASWTGADANSDILQVNTEDANGNNPASGAGRVTRLNSVGNAVVNSACITLTGANSYPFEAKVKLPSANAGVTQAKVTVRIYSDACTTQTGVQDSNVVNELAGAWQLLSGSITVGVSDTNARVDLVLLTANAGDLAYFDNVALANLVLDTPTPTNTPTATNTPAATNTATATNTPTATDTPTVTSTPTSTETMPATRTNTPIVTETPIVTNTPMPTATDIPAGAPPESANDTAPPPEVATPPADGTNPEAAPDGTIAGGDQAGAGVSPEGQAGAEGFPSSGYGPQRQGGGGSADAIAMLAFVVALVMLGAGFSMQRRGERGDE